MKWLASIFCAALLSAPALGEVDFCDRSEAACVLEAAWTAALVLPEEKRVRLSEPFLEIADLSGDAALLERWEERFDQSADSLAKYPDYGWQVAEPILESQGLDALISLAQRRADPLSFGRADVLLAAGRHFQASNPTAAQRINLAMMSMAKSASSFEQPNLAHASAELAMIRCDEDTLEDALKFTDAPDNLRYAFWRVRVSGSVRELLGDIRSVETSDDTRDVRRVLDGYRAILEHGYCADSKSQIGG